MPRLVSLALLLVGLALAVSAAAAPVKVEGFGSNPGNLDMYLHVPARVARGAPLVVVLHGCTQQAAAMVNSGIEALAEQHGFVVLYPQQKSANNPASCFNWGGEYGDPANLIRGQGENQSIIQMVDKVEADHGTDPAGVFVFGFSAGGGMAAVMLATWPERFAAGVIGAGVPYRCATDLSGSIACMNLAANPDRKREPAAWGDLVRAASSHTGPWPRVLVLHGERDTTVHPDGSAELVEQWTDVHGTDAAPDATDLVAGHQRLSFKAGDRVVVERWTIAGMGHAVPVDAAGGCGTPGAYFEDRGLCAAAEALRFFGLTGGGGGGGGDDDGGGGGGPGDGPDTRGGCAVAAAPGGLVFLLVACLVALRRRRAAR
jgi:poly(hydroxyalkanoate) depolymerase family esterase